MGSHDMVRNTKYEATGMFAGQYMHDGVVDEPFYI